MEKAEENETKHVKRLYMEEAKSSIQTVCDYRYQPIPLLLSYAH